MSEERSEEEREEPVVVPLLLFLSSSCKLIFVPVLVLLRAGEKQSGCEEAVPDVVLLALEPPRAALLLSTLALVRRARARSDSAGSQEVHNDELGMAKYSALWFTERKEETRTGKGDRRPTRSGTK